MNKREFIIAYVLTRAGLVENFNGVACVTRASEIYDAIPAGEDGGWQEWRGEKPYPEGMVDVGYRDGTVWNNIDSDTILWEHDLTLAGNDIIKWRPA